MTATQASRIDRVLDALVEQEAVDYAAVTSGSGEAVAEAGDLPEGDDDLEAGVAAASWDVPSRIRTMVEVGGGKVLHLGLARRLPTEELRQLRSAISSVV